MKKPILSAVVAMDEKRGIGKNDRVPWHLTSDLQRLKNLTKDQIVILGRKTYESMAQYYDKSGRPMPGKMYVIVTRDASYEPTRDNATVVLSPDEAIDRFSDKAEELFIIGGAQIFRQIIDRLDRLYITVVRGDYDADTFFPDYSSFTRETFREEKSQNEINFTILTLER